jgi:hypothetical protein
MKLTLSTDSFFVLKVREGAYHGHAYLESDIIKHDGSNAQNVTFWFDKYQPHTHLASLTVRQDDEIGYAGHGPLLLTAGERKGRSEDFLTCILTYSSF